MYQAPKGYALVPLQALGTPTRSPLRRTVFIVALIALGWFAFLRSPLVTNADTLSGTSSPGCVSQAVIFASSTTNVASYSIAFRGVIAGSIGSTVVVAHWWELPNGSTGPVHYFTGLPSPGLPTTGTFVLPGQYNVDQYGFRMTLTAGMTGTARHVVVVQSYNGAGCVTIDSVRVERVLAVGSATPPPGGGGIAAPTSTPVGWTPPPTAAPVGTPIAGATNGPGVWCDPATLYSVAGAVCYPLPPTGYCYLPQTGATPISVACDGTATPEPTPDLTTCAGLLTIHDFCWAWGTVTATGNTASGAFILDWDASEVVSVGGWSVIDTTRPGATDMYLTMAAGCTATGDWSTAGLGGADNYGVGSGPQTGYIEALDHSVGVRKTATTQDFTIASSGNNWGGTCTNSSVDKNIGLNIQYNAPGGGGTWSASGVVFVDIGEPVGQTPGAPTPTPEVSLPGNYWGCAGCTPPPPLSGFEPGDPVDICSVNPGITACAASFPPAGSLTLCTDYPTIAACATPAALAAPGSGGGGNGAPEGSGAPSGVEECVAASHPPKPGIVPLATMGTAPEPEGPWDIGAYAAWIGTHVSNIPKVAGNAVAGANNVAIEAVVPGECLGAIVETFTTDIEGRQPFSFFFAVRDALGAAPGAGVAFPTVDFGGASVDLDDTFVFVGSATAPYGAILRLIPWLIGGMIIFRHVRGTFGVGEGGG